MLPEDLTPYPSGYFEDDPLLVAPALLGAYLVHRHPERGLIAGRIVETEAYRGEEDLACHASKGRTARTEIMYGPPGMAYVYLIYGRYDLFNVVTWPEDEPAAVLVRALEPSFGIARTTDGPGKLTLAMGITREHNGIDLSGERLFVAPAPGLKPVRVESTERIGVDYAGVWAQRRWRFSIQDNPFVSRRTRRTGRKRQTSRVK